MNEYKNMMPTLASGSLQQYMSAVWSIPILSDEEEEQLSRRYYYNKDLDAARQLVLSHLRFVIYIAKTYTGYGLPIADLVQEGSVGLMKAVKRFNPEKKVKLVSFAVHWIKAEIHEYVLRNWRVVKVATTKAQRKLFFNLRKMKSSLAWLSQSEADSIAQDLGVNVKEVLTMEGRMFAADVGFDAPDNPDSDMADKMVAPVHYLTDSSNPAGIIEAADTSSVVGSHLVDALQQLDQRSRDIITARWLATGDAKQPTLHEMAATYNISAERVRQIEKKAMNKMKGMLSVVA